MTHAPAVIVYTPASLSFPLKGPRPLFQADPSECGPECTQVGFIYVTLQTSNSLERKDVELVKKFLFRLVMGLCSDPTKTHSMESYPQAPQKVTNHVWRVFAEVIMSN